MCIIDIQNLACLLLVETYFPDVCKADMFCDWVSEKPSVMLANNMIMFNKTSTNLLY